MSVCVVLQTTVFHREPTSALTAAERPGLWGMISLILSLSHISLSYGAMGF